MSRRDQLLSAYLHMDKVIDKPDKTLWYDYHFNSRIADLCPVPFVTEEHAEAGIEPTFCG